MKLIKPRDKRKAEAIKKYNDTLTKILQAQKTALIKKYGEKAYNYIKQGKIYVGMPAGTLRNTKKFKPTVQLFSCSLSREHSVTMQEFTVCMSQVEFSNYLENLE